MRQLLVQRTAHVLTLALVAASALFAWSVRGDARVGVARATAPSGESAFAQHCARCHAIADLSDGLRASDDRAAAVLAMLDKLAEHGNADDREDRAIVALLLARSRRP
jgi:mono/diheme cytochrome c family protein